MILQAFEKCGTQPLFIPQKLRIAYKESVCVWGGGGGGGCACSLIDLGFVNSQTKFFARNQNCVLSSFISFQCVLDTSGLAQA